MDEKCEMIRLLGGTFYSDPKSIPVLNLADSKVNLTNTDFLDDREDLYEFCV